MKSTIKDIEKISKEIHGWLHNIEGKLLYKLAGKCPENGVIVEIGSWKGKSTVWLASGAIKSNSKVYAIDPHNGNSSEIKEEYGEIDTYDTFIENITKAKLLEQITPIRKTSEEAIRNFDKEIDLLFIDGDHNYDEVKNDFDLWFPKLRNGGVIAFHDTVGTFSGPRKFVQKFIFKSDTFSKVKFVSSITYGVKVNKTRTINKVYNLICLFLHKVFHLLVCIYLFFKKS